VGLDWLENGGRWSPEQARRLAYVAATRARRRLFVLHEEPLAA
jgi:superfamily I DNA/RNA helicase